MENKEPKHIKSTKIIVIILAIGLIGYIFYENYIINQTFYYYYDIGSEQDAKKPYLTPAVRVSDIIEEEEVNYRKLTGGLVYFYVDIPRNSEIIYINAKIKDNFPYKKKMSLGASDDSEIWHYKWYNFYNQSDSNKNNWIDVNTYFNIQEENLSMENSRLSLIFNNPYLDQNKTEYINYTNNFIPVDYIEITIYKPGIFEKYGINSFGDLWEKIRK
ncbi:MAG: hypothetical protein V1824_02680 [archaeon]